MMKLTLPALVIAALAFAAPFVGAVEQLSEQTVANLSSAARVRSWDLASNNSNAPEIYRELIAAGGKPACQEKQILVNSDYVTKQDCAVVARVPQLKVIVNDIIWGSTTEVDVQGNTSCQAQWLAIAQGRHQVAELWTFCQFQGVAVPN
ncbi:MAG TPA: hypothetical protein VH309_11860 [Elusimicrobiota bacterium]|nr:hypothetical protein [Elusimicrobiota bacterium]